MTLPDRACIKWPPQKKLRYPAVIRRRYKTIPLRDQVHIQVAREAGLNLKKCSICGVECAHENFHVLHINGGHILLSKGIFPVTKLISLQRGVYPPRHRGHDQLLLFNRILSIRSTMIIRQKRIILAFLGVIVILLIGLAVLFYLYQEARSPATTKTSGVRSIGVRVVIESTADWAMIMFDDTKGTNTNGIGIKKIMEYGWLEGNDVDDIITVGTDLIKIDPDVNKSATGDSVGFNKQREDFDYTKMYADLTLNIDTTKDELYVYLIISGAGKTTFQLIEKESNNLIWEETVEGQLQTMYYRTYIPTESFQQK